MSENAMSFEQLVNNLQKVSYGQLLQMQAQFGNDYPTEKNPFTKPQEIANQFVKVGLTPALFVDYQHDRIFVTSEERIQKRLH